MDFAFKERYNIDDLVKIVKLLRSPEGCPWDKEQTHTSIRNNFIEETYEAVEAIDLNDNNLLREELGDVLLQILLHTQMEDEIGNFNFEDVCHDISKKLIYRHPHVFKNTGEISTSEVLTNWEALKNKEKERETASSRLESVPKTLPALMRSAKILKRASAFGFNYANVGQSIESIESAVDAFKQAVETEKDQDRKLADLLFSIANISTFLKIDAEEALSKKSDGFIERVKFVENCAQKQGLEVQKLTLEQLCDFWTKAVSEEN